MRRDVCLPPACRRRAFKLVLSDYMKSTEILSLEFNYAKDATLMAQDDRLKIVNFYLGLYATTLSIVFGLGNLTRQDNFLNFGILILFILSLIALIFTLQLIRLRQAWFDSIYTMNLIKKYFTDKDEELDKYLRWSINSLPKAEKFKTVSYFSALVIAVLGSLAFGIGLLFLGMGIFFSILLGIIYFAFLQLLYYFMLKLNI